jgi:hypothetical protein
MWRKWWVWLLALVFLFVAGLAVTAFILSRRLEPYVRQQTERYLRERFDADVEIGRLDASLPMSSSAKVILTRGKGAVVRASGDDITVWLRGRRDLPPLLKMGKVEFELDLLTLWSEPVDVRRVRLHQFVLTIPPKGERSSMPDVKFESDGVNVLIREVIADGSRLTLLSKRPDKAPLVFDLHQLRLFDAGPDRAMGYEAKLTNAKPPGIIVSNGTFGPWVAPEPSATPLAGDYTFEKADLGVFKGIAGILSSQGRFEGILQQVTVDGTTDTPDFRLTMSGNRVPLKTKFHAIVDATNGNTFLQPVEAQLKRTTFECRGGVARNRDEIGKTVELDVNLRRGMIEDLMLLAMKGPKPVLRGGIKLKMKLKLPPGRAEISDRLQFSGKFELIGAHFTSPTVQEQINTLSRKGKGQPQDEAIDEVPSDLAGEFTMERGKIRFSRLRFIVPGAAVELAGQYLFESEELDFRGKLRLQARVSETMTGWKRWVLKPVDPFFAKEGAGTVLKIAVTGTRSNPKFGLDRGQGN